MLGLKSTATTVCLWLFATPAVAQIRMPPIPASQMTDAQTQAAAAFRAARGAEVFGPFVPLLRSPQLMTRAEAMGAYLRYNSVLPARLSEVISAINAIAVDSEGTLWIAAREGAFRSTNAGDSWQPAGTLPLSNVVSIQYDPEQHRLLAAGEASTGIFESVDRGRAWRRTDSGWPLRNLSPAHGRLIAATPFDGLVMQPEMTTQVNEGAGDGNQ